MGNTPHAQFHLQIGLTPPAVPLAAMTTVASQRGDCTSRQVTI